jgi:hypothetical protein
MEVNFENFVYIMCGGIDNYNCFKGGRITEFDIPIFLEEKGFELDPIKIEKLIEILREENFFPGN